MTWIAGDWCFCEFELQQIKSVEDGRVTCVSDGLSEHGSYDLSDRCVPLTMQMKQISDRYLWASKRIHKEGSPGLNYPDIHRWLVAHWVETCKSEDVSRYAEIETFTETILTSQESNSSYGFPLLRRR